MTDTTEIQATEEQTLSVTQQAAPASDQLVDNANASEGQDNGFDIVLNDDEEKPKQDPATNAKFAAKRLERKRQRELEQQAEAVQRGELPDTLRVAPELPAQPDINAYLSDDGLAKYDYDQTRALAAFNAANTEWLMKAQDARSNAVAAQGKKTQEFTQQSAVYVDAARKHYDAAEKLNLSDYQAKEDAFRAMLAPGIDTEIMALFPEKSAAIFYHLGANPEKARNILSLPQTQAIIELTRLSDRLTLKPRGKQISGAPAVDEPVQGQAAAANRDSLQKQMEAAANKGDTATYRMLKQKLKELK
ncbi:scaffolding protein [Serratia sp. AS12]|uniref:scaffold protein n=1 Tax=Serratia TaxID=613 RepID=UPI00020EA0AA|nr:MULTISPECIES: scaffold protein [Serratia]AEF45810.1 scaffolding protein [Serratia plymuthica AS9]AEF50761.1 scaffolding protein [Serratia sp. AS12]AEG28468.1 scaffolding protein [Serratia sp. AS13]UTN94569.1 scaffolding protein [Serratia plymuthica]